MATTSRIPAQGTPNQDKTSRVLTNSAQPAPTSYTSPVSIVPTEYFTALQFALTGALTLNIGVGSSFTAPYLFDELLLTFTNASGSSQTVTLGTGIVVTAATLVVPTGKTGSITAYFNGTTWCESARSITV